MLPKVKVALLGCGRISDKHLAAFDVLSDQLSLVAVCDTNAALAEKKGEQHHAQIFTDYSTMLTKSDCDIVVLCTPSGLHPLQTIQAAKAGKHVVTEKPMAIRWQDGKRMVEACEEAGTHLFVVKQVRYTPAISQLKNALNQNRFGQLFMVNCNVFWMRPQQYYEDAPWRGTWSLDGGTFLNQSSHYFDLMTWLFGKVKSVQAMTATLARKIEAEDSGVVNLQWENGALGAINVTMLTYPKNLEGSITVLGEKGTVKLGGMGANQVIEWDFSDYKPIDKTIKDIHLENISPHECGHARYYQNVLDVLHQKCAPETNGSEGLKSLELISAAYQSAHLGKTISIPFTLSEELENEIFCS
jgi:UDP-N-acetyl-2-amino-2-deoxyglucuronate dehydrogenase